LDQTEALCDFLDGEFDTVNDGEGEMLIHTEEDPFFQHLHQLCAAVFQGSSVGVYPITDGDFPVERPIVRQDFVGSMA
jgi:hypothetical protein